jgi:hypothetical protein
MKLRAWPLAALVLALTAAQARAEAYLIPNLGVAFGDDVEDSKLSYGGSLAFAGEDGVFGFGLDFAYTPDFFGSGPGKNNVTTLMANLMLLSPGRARIYGSGGLGLLKTRVESVGGFLDADSNELGLNVGGGLLLVPGTLGVQGDVRYFRRLTDPEPDDEFDVALGNLSYWRAVGGLVIKF